MEPVKVPQNLELEDVVVWGLGAVDLICVAVGAVLAWWLYLFAPGNVDVRIGIAVLVAGAGLAGGIGRLGDLALRDWLLLFARYGRRPRWLLVGVER